MAWSKYCAPLALVAGVWGLMGTAAADPVADFYKDKTINVVIGYPAGGGFDAYGRLISDQLPKFLPGKPRSTVQYMPGAAALKSVSNIYNVAPRDGTVLGMASTQLVFNAYVRNEVGDRVDVAKLNWIGRIAEMDSVVVVWHTTGIKTFDDLKTRKVFFGATSATAGSASIPYVMNRMFGTKIEVALGYGGTTEQYMAMERGEIDGVTNAQWSQLRRSHPEWLREKKLVPIAHDGYERYDSLPQVPTLLELAEKEQDRRILRLMGIPSIFGRSFYAGPDIPPERVVALRKAFMTMAKDPGVQAEVKKLDLDVDPLPGETLQATVDEVAGYPKELFELTLKMITPEKAR